MDILDEETDEFYFPVPETMAWECKMNREDYE